MPTRSWWRSFNHVPDAALRLICFPHAGGHAGLFCSWHRHLPSALEVCGVQLPGRGPRINEPPIDRMAQLVPALGAALVPLCDRPVAFLGHSLGAVVAFEVARWLRRHYDLLPRHLFVSGRRAPQLPDPDPPTYAESDEAFIAVLHELKGTPPDVLAHPELLPLLLPALRADFAMSQTYAYLDEPPLACPITAFAGTTDGETDGALLDGWRRQTTDRYAQHRFDGDHFFIYPLEAEVAARTEHDLARLLAPSFAR